MKKELETYYNAIGKRESGNNYKSVNSVGYIGKYQMGEAAMIDAGYYKKSSRNYNNDWSGQFTGKDGVYSVEDFLNNPKAQENAMHIYKNKQWGYIKKFAPTYSGKIINGKPVTYSGMLAATHLLGQQALEDYLKSGGKIKASDGYGTNIEEYLHKFSGYDVSSITGLPDDSYLMSKPIKENSQVQTIQTQIPIQANSINTPFKLGIEYNDYQQNNLPDLNDLMINPINQQPDNPWDMIPMAIPESLRQPSGAPTGQAANFDINQLANILGIQLPEVQSKQDLGLFGYTNPLTGSNHIYTREEVGQMSSDEFAKHEKEIDAQTKYFKGIMPTNGDLQREAMTSGGVVYVNSYTRSDGTEVRGYYRSRPSI